MARYVVDVNNPAAPTDTQGATQGAEEIRALKLKLQAAIAGALIVSSAGANPADCTNLVYPDINDRPAMVAGGWKPWNLNQQWGGAGCMPFHMVDSATGVEYKFDTFDAYIDVNDAAGQTIGAIAAAYYRYQSITPAKNLALQAMWLKLVKVGNPVDNFTVQLYSVAAGIPGVLIATANVINGKQITTDTSGQWYRFVFPAVQNLVAGTQYIIAMSKSAGVDAANYYVTVARSATRNPNNLWGFGTVVPAWTAGNTNSSGYICEAQASDQPIQSAGVFDGRIVGSGTGNPVNHSVGYCNELRNFFPLFNPNGWSIRLGGKSWNKDCTIFEAMYGLHHDRINVRCAVGTGFTTVTVYKQDGTVVTLNGTSDISPAAYKDVWVCGRSMGDGGDYLRIYVGTGGIWSKEAEIIGQTFTFDPLMLRLGTAWLMGGFQLFSNATYTKLHDMSVLPSADGLTFTTTTGTVEGNVFAISGGKLNQIKAGMAAGGDGWYRNGAAAFSNPNGWLVTWKGRNSFSNNTKDTADLILQVQDGTKFHSVNIKEYFLNTINSAVSYYPQIDLKNNDNVILMSGKGSDNLIFVNGKLVIDNTSVITTGSANNFLDLGDINTGAQENVDAVHDYLGRYVTSNIYPQFTSGELHEFACFSGEKGNLGQALYNGGIPLSVKQYCGIGKNYIGEQVSNKTLVRGVTNTPVTASASLVLEADMEGFILGTGIALDGINSLQDSAAGTINYGLSVDGILINSQQWFCGAANWSAPIPSLMRLTPFNFGLHKFDRKFSTNAGNLSALGSYVRVLQAEAKAYP